MLSAVGLINGYAKVGQDSGGLLDWYAGNRRILEVEWTFDDGTVVSQPLSETASMQTITLNDVEYRVRHPATAQGQRPRHGPLLPRLHRHQRRQSPRHAVLVRESTRTLPVPPSRLFFTRVRAPVRRLGAVSVRVSADSPHRW